MFCSNSINVILAKRRTEQVILGAALFLAALLLLTACGGSGGGLGGGSGGGSEGVVVIGSGNASASGSASADPITQTCQPPDMEGCYGYGDMQAYADQIIPLVEAFFDDTYADMPHPKQYIYIPEGTVASSACGNLPAEVAYHYCPGDDKIYLGQPELWTFYSNDGDAAPVVGVAHEWGHHVQSMTGVPEAKSNVAQITRENQADCVAGAWLAYADKKGWLTYPDDLNDIKAVLKEVASTEPNRDHGDLDERRQSMRLGRRNGLQGCNDFYQIIVEGTTPSASSGATPSATPSASPSASPTSSSSASASP